MQIKFKAPMFEWLKNNCVDVSIPAYITGLIQREMDDPYKGVNNGKETDSSKEQLHKDW